MVSNTWLHKAAEEQFLGAYGPARYLAESFASDGVTN